MFNSVVYGMGRLLAYFYDFIPSYGVAIVLLTVLVRVMMIPLAIKQAKIMEANRGNAEKMRSLAPEVKKLKDKYKDDRAKQYEEQKKLYDQHGVNMLGGLSGCLPMLLQMPVFYAMYSVLSGCNKIIGSGRVCKVGFHVPDGSALKAAIVDGQATFLGMNLNSLPSKALQEVGLLRALPYYLLIAVMGYTMWYQSRQMMRAQPVVDPQMAQTQKIMQFLPLMLVFASLSFPAGLTVYWSATNIWAIGQQYVLMRRFGTAAGADTSKKGDSAKAPRAAKPEAKGFGANAKGPSKTGGKVPAKPVSGKAAGVGATKQPPGARATGPAAKPKPGGTSNGRAATQKSRTGSAAQRTRITSAKGSAAAAKSPGSSAAKSGAATEAGTPASPARPKGSGARKGNKGGRR